MRRSVILFILAFFIAAAASCGITESTHAEQIDCTTFGGDWDVDTRSCRRRVYPSYPPIDASDAANRTPRYDAGDGDADADADLDAAIDGSDAD